MAKGKHLQFYIDCMSTLTMPGDGLCLNTEDCGGPLSESLLYMLTPTYEECYQLRFEGYSSSYWGSGITLDEAEAYNAFTPLRQTIVLFMACLNNEL